MQRIESFDIDTLHLRSGDGRRIDAVIPVDPLTLAGQTYAVEDGEVEARLDISRTVSGFALRLRFEAQLDGTCMRCMSEGGPRVSVDAREVDQPGEAEEFHSPYLDGPLLNLADWAREALALATPTKVLCREDCRGLCTVCGGNLNDEDPAEHRHQEEIDPRWAKLGELKL
jgi:uncharacterized protein